MPCEAKHCLHWTSPDKLEDIGGLWCHKCQQSLFDNWRPYNCPDKKPYKQIEESKK